NHDEDEGDQQAVDRRVSQLRASFGPHPLDAQRRLRHDFGTKRRLQTGHQLVTSALQQNLNAVLALVLHVHVVAARAQGDSAYATGKLLAYPVQIRCPAKTNGYLLTAGTK